MSYRNEFAPTDDFNTSFPSTSEEAKEVSETLDTAVEKEQPFIIPKKKKVYSQSQRSEGKDSAPSKKEGVIANCFSVNIRKDKDSTSTIVHTVKAGTKVYVLEIQGGYCSITFSQKADKPEGYIPVDFLSFNTNP